MRRRKFIRVSVHLSILIWAFFSLFGHLLILTLKVLILKIDTCKVKIDTFRSKLKNSQKMKKKYLRCYTRELGRPKLTVSLWGRLDQDQLLDQSVLYETVSRWDNLKTKSPKLKVSIIGLFNSSMRHVTVRPSHTRICVIRLARRPPY